MANAEFVKANNTTQLADPLSWSTAGGPPLSTDVGSWAIGANTVTASANTFNPGAIWVKSGQTGNITIQQPVTIAGLTTSVSGLPIGTGVKIDAQAVFIERAVTIAASQTWDVSGGIYNGLNNAAGTLTAASGVTLTKKGSGSFGSFRASPGLGAGVFIDVEAGRLTYGPVSTPFGNATIRLNSAGTAPTVTLTPDSSVGTTVTLANPIVIAGNCALIADFAGSVTSTMTLSGTVSITATTPTITVNKSTATISGPIIGTAGFTKAGSGALFITKNAGTTLSGVITQNAGYVQLGSSTADGNVFPVAGITNWAVNTSTAADPLAINTNTTIDPLHIDTFTGTGGVQCMAANGTYIQFKAGALVGLTPAAGSNGFCWQTPSAANVTSTLKVKDFPASGRMTWLFQANTQTGIVEFNGVASGSYSPAIAIQRQGALTGLSPVIAANGSAGAALTLGGTLTNEGTGGTTITLTLRGTNTDNNTYSGVMSNGANTLGVTKADAGRWILTNNNSFSGGASVTEGTLSIQHNNGLGAASGNVSVTSGATLELQNASPAKSSAALTLNGNGVTVGGVVQGALCSVVGENTYAASGYTLGSNSTIRVAAGSLTLSGGAVGNTSAGTALTKTGAGKLVLPQTNNNYSGITTVSEGTLAANTLAPVNSVSSLGQPTTVANGTIKMGAGTTLQHIGTLANSTDRVIELLAAGELAIDGSGTSAGALTLLATGSFTLPAGAKTLRFSGTSAAANTCARAISNGASGVTELKKSGNNIWNLTGALTHTGLTTVEGGTLNLDGGAARVLAGGVAISHGTLANGSQTLETTTVTMTGGTVTAKLAFGTAVSVTSGTATLQPNGNANAHTGATIVAAGAKLDLITGDSPATAGAGKAAGDGQVTVNGEIRTSNNSTQRGQMRYKNLSFGNNATLRIGYAGT